MSRCQPLLDQAADGLSSALRAVDCIANETTASAFARLFGGQGVLLPALTILLTLYVAFFALTLLTGRSQLSVAALTPRMLTLGVILTFATSWVAYQGVMWTLATGAPDQIAGVLTGAGNASATQIFVDRVDLLVNAIAERAGAAAVPAGPAPSAANPSTLIWLATLMLLLGTVGVLLTAKIVLAMLLALGPIFVVLALFRGSRGLFAGWLRGTVFAAVIPLFVVLSGGIMLQLFVPVVAAMEEGATGRGAIALFIVAVVHLALIGLSLRVLQTMLTGWDVFGLAPAEPVRADTRASAGAAAGAHAAISRGSVPATAALPSAPTVEARVNAVAGPAPGAAILTQSAPRATAALAPVLGAAPTTPGVLPSRTLGIGAQFAAPPPTALPALSKALR